MKKQTKLDTRKNESRRTKVEGKIIIQPPEGYGDLWNGSAN